MPTPPGASGTGCSAVCRNAVGQTTDGYLWIGTDAGLVRFDGVRFVPWAPPQDTPLPSSTVLSLLGARDGSLWIGTTAGLAHWTNGRLVRFPEVGGRVNAILEDDDGAIWIARSRISGSRGRRGRSAASTRARLRCYGEAEGIACRVAQRSRRTRAEPSGSADRTGSVDGSPARRRTICSESSRRSRAAQASPPWPLARREDSGWGVACRPGLRSSAVRGRNVGTLCASGHWMAARSRSSALLVDANGSLWIGTSDQGLYRVAGGRADHFRSADGLSSDTVSALYQDREGSLWVVTSKGIDRLRDYRVMTFSAREGLTGDNVSSVLATADGTVWVGNLGALNALRGSDSVVHRAPPGPARRQRHVALRGSSRPDVGGRRQQPLRIRRRPISPRQDAAWWAPGDRPRHDRRQRPQPLGRGGRRASGPRPHPGPRGA